MGFWDFWKEEAKDYVHDWLDPAQTPGIAFSPINAESSYVTVQLRKMRIVNVRVGFKRFYGAVHAGRKIHFKQLIAPVRAENLDLTCHLNGHRVRLTLRRRPTGPWNGSGHSRRVFGILLD